MSTPAPAKKKRHSFGTTEVSVYAEVDLDDIIDDLIADGEIHYAEDCPGAMVSDISRETRYDGLPDIIGSLHRQAHPTAHPNPFLCNEEPCRSLPSDLTFNRISAR